MSNLTERTDAELERRSKSATANPRGVCDTTTQLLLDLKEEIDRLREALVRIAETENYVSHENLWEERPSLPAREMWDIAKQALEGGE